MKILNDAVLGGGLRSAFVARPLGATLLGHSHPRGTNLALYERCSAAWEEELLGDLMHWPTASAEPAVLELLDAHGWGLVG